jgi:glycerol-3-phosphate dehydrogenase
MKLHGWDTSWIHDASEWERVYGSDLPSVRALAASSPELNAHIHPLLPFRMSEVIWAARNEMARTTEDILARRTRALFLNARAAIEAAPAVAHLLGQELHRSETWIEQDRKAFLALAKGYLGEEN